VVLVVVAAGAATLAVGGYRRSEVLLSSGTIWLASPDGLVTLIDGPSEQVVGNVQTSATGPDAPEVVQAGNSALVVDQQRGTLSRIDGATYVLTGPKRVGEGGPLQVLPAGGDSAYVLDGRHGRAFLIDTTTLQVQRPVRLGAQPGPDQAAVDGSGNLWVVDGGGLARVDRSGTVKRFRGAGDDATSRLVTSRGKPVLVDLTGGRIGRIDDNGAVPSWQCTGLHLGSDPQLLAASSTDHVFAAVPATGRLLTADLSRRSCTSTPLGAAGSALGRPVADDGFVLVPDVSQGRAIVVAPGAKGVVAREQVGTAGRDVQLVTKDGLVFYNDLTGPDAGVLRVQDGRWVPSPRLAKFLPGGAVPSLAAAESLPSGQSLPGLPSAPSGTGPSTTFTVPSTTGSTTSNSAPATTTTPTTTWPTTTWPTPTDTTPTTTPTESPTPTPTESPTPTPTDTSTPTIIIGPLPTLSFTLAPPVPLPGG
jgi:cell division septation protein DedD